MLDTLEYLQRETTVWFEITSLVIPGLNDSDAEFDAMTQWIGEHLGPDVPIHFTAFHPDWKLLDRPPASPTTLTRARDIALGNGLRYAYTGNVHDPRGSSTYCHGCGAVVVERDGYTLRGWRLTSDGYCLACGTPCAGVFDGAPGTWGPRRRAYRSRSCNHEPRRGGWTPRAPGHWVRDELAVPDRLEAWDREHRAPAAPGRAHRG